MSPRTPHTVGNRQAGFTLIEILAVIAILALLGGLAMTAVTNAQEKSRVVACQLQMRTLAQTMKGYVDTRKNGKWPKKAGAAFLLELYFKDEMTGKDTSNFICPGTQDENAGGDVYGDPDDIDPTTISYAGRDNLEYPIDINRLNEMIIAADDNDGRGNHKHTTNVAYADGSVIPYDVSDYDAELEMLGISYLPVGPDSPVEELQVLSLD